MPKDTFVLYDGHDIFKEYNDEIIKEIVDDRKKYDIYFTILEKYIHDKDIIVCGSAAYSLMMGVDLPYNEYKYDLLCKNIFEHARAIATAFFEETRNNYIYVHTNILNREITVIVDERELVNLTFIDQYKGANLLDNIGSFECQGLFAQEVKIKIAGIEIQMIDVLRNLYSPNLNKLWEEDQIELNNLMKRFEKPKEKEIEIKGGDEELDINNVELINFEDKFIFGEGESATSDSKSDISFTDIIGALDDEVDVIDNVVEGEIEINAEAIVEGEAEAKSEAEGEAEEIDFHDLILGGSESIEENDAEPALISEHIIMQSDDAGGRGYVIGDETLPIVAGGAEVSEKLATKLEKLHLIHMYDNIYISQIKIEDIARGSGVSVYNENTIKLPRDFRLRRTTFYSDDKRPLFYVYNCAQYDLINNSPFVKLRIMLIELWVLRLIRDIGEINAAFANKKIEDLYDNIIKLFEKTKNASEDKLFPFDYVGTYYEERIAKKQQMLALRKTVIPNWYPAKHFITV